MRWNPLSRSVANPSLLCRRRARLRLEALEERTLLEVFADAPSSTRPRPDLEGPGLPLVDALAD